MIGALSLALRAIWWRKGASAVVLVVAVFATGTAAAGPMFLQGAGQSVLRDALVSAPATAAGTGLEVTKDAVGRSGSSPLESAVTKAMLGSSLPRRYPRHIISLERRTRVLDEHADVLGRVTVVSRQGVCRHVRIRAGRCLGEGSANEVMVSEVDARRLNWAIGRQLGVDAFQDAPAGSATRPMILVGIYAPMDPGGEYWFNDTRGYFGGNQRRQEQVQGQPAADRTLEAAFVGTGAFADVTASEAGPVLVVDDLLLDRKSTTWTAVPRLRADLDQFGVRLAAAKVNQGLLVEAVNTRVRQVLDAADTGVSSLRRPILVVLVELVLLGVFALFIVVAGAAEARSGEVALAKLRGLPTGTVLSFGLLETVSLLVVAAPLGAVASWLWLSLTASSLFGEGVRVELSPVVWGAVAATTAGGLVAGILASSRSLRKPVIDLGRRTSGRRSGRGMALEAAVVMLAAATLWQLWTGPRAAEAVTGDVDVLALLAPTLLALAGALVGARGLPLVAALACSLTRRTQHLGLFIGSRELSRRPGGTRLLVVLTTAFALTTFSVVGAQVFAANRIDRARTEVGADRVVHVDPYSGVDLAEIVDRLDPSGTQAMPVAQAVSAVSGAISSDGGVTSGPTQEPATLLVADPARLVSTGFWRSDFAAASWPELVAGLTRPFPEPKSWRGAQLRMAISTKLVCCGTLAARLAATGPDGHRFTVPMGRLVPGSHVLTVNTPECAVRACRLRGLLLSRDAPGAYSVVGQLVLTSLEAGHDGRFQPVDGATEPIAWQAIDAEPAGEQIVARPGGLQLSFAAPSRVRDFGLTATVPTRISAVVTSAYRPAPGTNGYQISLPSGVPLAIEVTGVAKVLPRAGTKGILLPLGMLGAARSLGDEQVLPNQVWLTARAAPDFPARLAAAGVPVLGVQSAAARAQDLARQGPALAVIFLLVGAIAAAGLAVSVAMVSLYLIARRRSFELAALRALGFPPRKVLSAAVAEQALLAGFAVGLGVTLGVLGARLGLPSIPEFADGGTIPALLIGIDPGRVLVVAGVLSAVLGAGIAVSGAILTASAGPTRLREGQA